MRWRQLGSVAVATAALIGLSGCVQVPPRISDAAAERAYEEMLTRSWVSSGLATTTERPAAVVGSPLDSDEWVATYFECMADKGYDSYALLFDPAVGYALDTGGATPVAGQAEVETAFFTCLAAHSQAAGTSPVRTRAQLDYVYDYFESWLVPCLVHHGLAPRTVMTRAAFVASGGGWSPYAETGANFVPTDEREALVAACGPDQPPLG